MASTESSSLSQSSIANIDEFEGLEAIEFDANTIRELLYEPLEEVDNGETLMEFAEASPGLTFDSEWCLGDIIDNAQDFDWIDMLEEASPLCNDIGALYEDISQVFEIGDYPFSQSANVYDDIGYLGLWQEN